MDKQELKKKVAEWAGFRKVKHFDGEDLVEKWLHDGLYYLALPDFPQSLDACFKWLVPKALRVLGGIHQVRTQKTQEILFRFWLEERWEIDEPDMDALALCLAVEKLIDGEKGNPVVEG